MLLLLNDIMVVSTVLSFIYFILHFPFNFRYCLHTDPFGHSGFTPFLYHAMDYKAFIPNRIPDPIKQVMFCVILYIRKYTYLRVIARVLLYFTSYVRICKTINFDHLSLETSCYVNSSGSVISLYILDIFWDAVTIQY